MDTTKKKARRMVTTAELRDRGFRLGQRLRVAGFPQYARWFTEVNPAWRGDASIQHRIRMLINCRAGMGDLELLEICEGLADKHLGRDRQAA